MQQQQQLKQSKSKDNNSSEETKNDKNESSLILAAEIDDVFFCQIGEQQRTDLLVQSLQAMGGLFYTRGEDQEAEDSLEEAVGLLRKKIAPLLKEEEGKGLQPPPGEEMDQLVLPTRKQMTQIMRNISKIYYHMDNLDRTTNALHDAIDLQILPYDEHQHQHQQLLWNKSI